VKLNKEICLMEEESKHIEEEKKETEFENPAL
jgi:hypothetical protein